MKKLAGTAFLSILHIFKGFGRYRWFWLGVQTLIGLELVSQILTASNPANPYNPNMVSRTDFTEQELAMALQRHQNRQWYSVLCYAAMLLLLVPVYYLAPSWMAPVLLLEPFIAFLIQAIIVSAGASSDREVLREAVKQQRAVQSSQGWLS